MTIEAEILSLVARGRLQQLILVVALVRIMALDAVAHRRRMDRSLQRRGIFVRVAAQAERLWSRRGQLDPRDVFVDAHLMTAQTSRGDRGVNGFALGLVLVAFEAFRRIHILVERHWMLFRPSRPCRNQQEQGQQLQKTGEGSSNWISFDWRCAAG